MSFVRYYNIEPHERIKQILIFLATKAYFCLGGSQTFGYVLKLLPEPLKTSNYLFRCFNFLKRMSMWSA